MSLCLFIFKEELDLCKCLTKIRNNIFGVL